MLSCEFRVTDSPKPRLAVTEVQTPTVTLNSLYQNRVWKNESLNVAFLTPLIHYSTLNDLTTPSGRNLRYLARATADLFPPNHVYNFYSILTIHKRLIFLEFLSAATKFWTFLYLLVLGSPLCFYLGFGFTDIYAVGRTCLSSLSGLGRERLWLEAWCYSQADHTHTEENIGRYWKGQGWSIPLLGPVSILYISWNTIT